MKKKTLNKLYRIIKTAKGVSFSKICNVSGHHHHTVRKYLKYMMQKGVITYTKIGAYKIYSTMKNRLLMFYTKQERDELYYNYLRHFKFGINLNRVSKDLNIDKRSFKKEIKRLVKQGIVSEEKEGNMILYKVVEKWQKKR